MRMMSLVSYPFLFNFFINVPPPAYINASICYSGKWNGTLVSIKKKNNPSNTFFPDCANLTAFVIKFLSFGGPCKRNFSIGASPRLYSDSRIQFKDTTGTPKQIEYKSLKVLEYFSITSTWKVSLQLLIIVILVVGVKERLKAEINTFFVTRLLLG